MKDVHTCQNWESVRPVVAELSQRLGLPESTPWLILKKDEPLSWCSASDEADVGQKGYEPEKFSAEKLGALEWCGEETCSQYQERVNHFCHRVGYPAGAKVIIARPDRTYCYCCCGGPCGQANEDEATKGEFEPVLLIL